MRISKLITLSALLAFAIVAVFGLYLTFAIPDHHDAGCPLMPGTAMLCENSLLTHLDHWQSAFTATLADFFTLLAIAILAVVVVPFKLPDKRYERLRIYPHAPLRPSLFQELFSQGILHPKAP